MLLRRLPLLVLALFAVSALAQNIISARAGYVNYKHGDVILPTDRDGKSARQLREGESAITRHGRVELLLAPGTYLRLDNESEARLLSSRLDNVRVELVSGAASLEVNEILKDSSTVLEWRGNLIPITHTGLYRFEANPESMRIYVEAGKLKLAGTKGTVKAGRFVDLNSQGVYTAAAKYNRKDVDEFDEFNVRRGFVLSRASYRAADAFLSRPFAYRSSFWFLDPFTGFFTYMPFSPFVASPFGFYYIGPRYVYHHPPSSGGGTVKPPSSGGGSSPAPPKASPPPPSPSPRPSSPRMSQEGPRSIGRPKLP